MHTVVRGNRRHARGRMCVTGASLLARVSYALLLIFCGAGTVHIFVPSPPCSTLNIAGAAAACFTGIILMALTNCIAFHLGVISTLDPRKPADVARARRLWGDIFKVIPRGISLWKNVTKPANPV
jgi:hypothetical protein